MMGLKSDKMKYFKENYQKIPSNTLKNTYSLELKCNRCRKCKSDDYNFSNINFLECIFNVIALEMEIDIESLQVHDDIVFSRNQVIEIKDFIEYVPKFENFNKKLVENLKVDCLKYNCLCFFSDITKPKEFSEIFSKKYILKHFIQYIQYIEKIKELLINNNGCINCLKIGIQSIEKILEVFRNIKIVKKLLIINQDLNYFLDMDSFNILNYLLMGNFETRLNKPGKEPFNLTRIDQYFLNNSPVLEYNIYSIEKKLEKLYEIKQNIPFSGEFLDFLKSEVDRELKEDESILKFHKFNEMLNYILRFTKQKLHNLLTIENEDVFESLVQIITFSLIGLEKLFPLLVDDNIEEIFLDSPSDCIYIHHIVHQQCITNIKLENYEINRIVSLLRFETNKNLNELFPTLKCVIKNSFFYIRINVDIKPLNYNGFSLDIRRLNKKVFDIIDLIRLDSISLEVAAILTFCIQVKCNLKRRGEEKWIKDVIS
ncbi:MAG: hypothetical protein ACFFCS_15645 [Candidatus Hodarchaeota archaeon]